MTSRFKRNCCDGVYNSFDVHFTSACDNKCRHCIDLKYEGLGINKPDADAIADTIITNQAGYDDVLFLGGEPCLYLEELINCVEMIQAETSLKVFVTTAVPKTCYTNYLAFWKLLNLVDGINLSVQHYKEDIADEIRNTKSTYDRQKFYSSLPLKHKIRINLNIVKPYLYKAIDIGLCLNHYDKMGFNQIKLSEIQHGKEHFVSFEKTFRTNLGSPYYHGCQTILDMQKIISLEFKTPILLKRSCFLCEDTLKASLMDGVKVAQRIFNKPHNQYGVVYEDGSLSDRWR